MHAKPQTCDPARCHDIATRFAIRRPISVISPLGRGLINDTFRLEAGGQVYVLQRINARVFPDPAQIMTNLRVLSNHLADLDDPGLRLPALIPTREGADFLCDVDNGVWRLLEFIPDTVTLSQIERAGQAREVGRILGGLHRAVASLPTTRLGFALPSFHATPDYLARLLTVAAHNTSDSADCLEFVSARRELAGVLETAHQAGRIRQRVIHGDPKLDNILFDQTGDCARALIDLDTVQPGLLQHDLGDCLRSCCNRVGEQGGAEVRFDLSLCANILRGYASETRDILTAADIALFYDAIRLLPFELGLRFLTDHLEGDRYFRVSRHGENLHKAQVQFALVADIERQEQALRTLIVECFGDVILQPHG